MFSIQLARQGQTMEQGTVVEWKKSEGDELAVGESLYEIETEKAIVPIEVTRPGRLLKVLVGAGETVSVGTVLALAADPGEQVLPAQLERAIRTGELSQENPTPTPSAGPQTIGAEQGGANVRAGSGTKTKAAAVPKARALAQELGVNLANVTGTGENGTILPEDVRRAAQAGSSASRASQGRRVPLSPIARTTIAALERAWQTPQFTQGILVDATGLQRAKATSAGALSYMDFFLDAIVRAAQTVPEVLARLTEGEIVYSDSVDISIATATEAGLLIPVLRDAAGHSVEQRRGAWQSLVERARAGRLAPQEMSGGLLALSNLGTRGVDYGTPLLPYGHSAIVFVGSMANRPLAIGDSLEVRPSVHVAITYDHRVVDGVLGSRFTGAINEALLSPAV
ncbi:MAG TPA: dihydrolipoamide acetyltransferase family protein [Steroidobacteraceae bacterium]|nr:dihydrolipoamide acetyltransferase family protein [Steroidobacteraceae bacterium]